MRVPVILSAVVLTGCQLVGGLDDFEVAETTSPASVGGGGAGAAGGSGGQGGGGRGGSGGQGGTGGIMPPVCGAVTYVDEAVSGGDGSSWPTAFADLQVALAHVADCGSIAEEIRIARGVYVPGDTPTATFALVENVRVLGGYAAMGDQRDPQTFVTVLSGDIDRDDTQGGRVADIVGTNVHHVVTAPASGGQVELDGLTVRGGDSLAGEDGAGIRAEGGAVTLNDVVLEGNRAGGLGGGLHVTGALTATALTVQFNEAEDGGGLASVDATTTLDRVMVASNESRSRGGGLYLDGGTVALTGVRVTGNVAQLDGGGAFMVNGMETVENGVFAGNHAVRHGGGLYDADGIGLVNATVHGNRADDGGGLFFATGTVASTLVNSVVTGNVADAAPTEPLVGSVSGSTAMLTVSSSAVDGAFVGATWQAGAGTDGGSNISTEADTFNGIFEPLDPQLAPQEARHGLAVRGNSPCLNAGDDSAVTTATDEAGAPRIAHGAVDMGAIEVGGPCEVRVYVDRDATGPQLGNSWSAAFNDLQSAFAQQRACAGTVEIWVGEGIYRPGRLFSDSFDPDSNTELYGGFDGTEQMLSERDVAANPVVLSGDIDGDDMNVVGGVTPTFADHVGQNNRKIVRVAGGEPVRIDGVTVTGGNAPSFTQGGGIRAEGDGDLVVANARIIGNRAESRGGGILFEGDNGTYSLEIIDTAIMGNHADIAGGGVYVTGGGTCTVTGAHFEGNQAFGGNGIGAGLRTLNVYLVVEDSSFVSNFATNAGGMFLVGGSEVRRCSFRGNEATTGTGALSLNAVSTHTVEDTLFIGNHSDSGASALRLLGATATVTNVSFIANRSLSLLHGAIWFTDDTGPLDLNNCLGWGNTPLGTPDWITRDFADDALFRVRNSLLEGFGASGAGWPFGTQTDGGGNIAGPPTFVAAPSAMDTPTVVGDAHLVAGSPGIDAGDDALVTSVLDLDGAARVQGAAVDMGCYESP